MTETFEEETLNALHLKNEVFTDENIIKNNFHQLEADMNENNDVDPHKHSNGEEVRLSDSLTEQQKKTFVENTEHKSSNSSKATVEEAEKGPQRKILIIGGGVAGLTLALAIKRVAQKTGLNLIPVIYESQTTYSEVGTHFILWRWAVETLLEMGMGKLLGKVSWPILNFKSLDADTKETVVQWPPDSVTHENIDSFHHNDPLEDSLPPMLGTRKSDLLRLLMLGLAGCRDSDLVDDADFHSSGANNSDIAPEPVEGVEGDLARDNWFGKEKWRKLLPELKLGYEFDFYSISPTTGAVTATFFNGLSETGDMIIGADGVNSRVKEYLFDGKVAPQHAGAAVFSGICRIHVPPVDTQTELEDGRLIEDMTREDIYSFCPEGSAISIIGRGLAFGATNIGNGMLGWHLVASQSEPSQHIEKVLMAKRKQQVSEALKSNPRMSIIMNTPPLNNRWKIPNSDDESEENNSTPQSTPPRSLSHQASPISSIDFLQPVTSTQLTGAEIRTLALRLSQTLPIPHPGHAIMARTASEFCSVEDVMDVADDQPASYTNPNLHPGRIIIIGDSAHAVACNAHGSVGAGLAITDAGLLAKLIGKHLNKFSTKNDSQSFQKIGKEFDDYRVEICNAAVKEARSEGGWGRTENAWVRSLLRITNKYAPNWSKVSYETMLTRGRISNNEELPSLSPILKK
ncbi:hypothetical protein HDU92_002556 [Lobulomyces angularis]|nr:hypothetical protein HDU92_002556 [Lobulomyces angularis]